MALTLPDLMYGDIYMHLIGFDNWCKTSSGELLGRLLVNVGAEW